MSSMLLEHGAWIWQSQWWSAVSQCWGSSRVGDLFNPNLKATLGFLYDAFNTVRRCFKFLATRFKSHLAAWDPWRWLKLDWGFSRFTKVRWNGDQEIRTGATFQCNSSMFCSPVIDRGVARLLKDAEDCWEPLRTLERLQRGHQLVPAPETDQNSEKKIKDSSGEAGDSCADCQDGRHKSNGDYRTEYDK